MHRSDAAGRPITVLMADDDEEDCELVRDALGDTRVADAMRFVADGQELIDYLRRDGPYCDTSPPPPRPAIILLDLNMPRKDGREALAEIKADRALRQIPVVVLTTSSDEEDVLRSYDLGANSFITKPVVLAQLLETMETFVRYWVETTELPNGEL